MFQFSSWVLNFTLILNFSCHNADIFVLFYRSNDSNSMNGVTIIVVAILLLFVLVLVFVVLYIRNQFGFRDKARQCITGTCINISFSEFIYKSFPWCIRHLWQKCEMLNCCFSVFFTWGTFLTQILFFPWTFTIDFSWFYIIII